MIISKKKSKLRNIFENVFFVTEMKRIFKWFLPIIIIVFAHNLYAQNIYYTDDYVANTEATDNVISTKNDAVLITVGENYTPPFLVSFFSGKDKISTVEMLNNNFFVDASKISSFILTDSNKKELEIKINHGRNYFIPLLIIAFLVFIAMLIFLLFQEHKKYERAICRNNELDVPIERRSKKFDLSTVLFADIQGFTKIAEHMNPEQLVDELDRYFIFFDELVEKYNVEKIKTIGDAYMCAGGVPKSNSANPIEVTLVGLGMIAYVRDRQASSHEFWNIRVGINTGPVISGSLGFKKKSFDIWGDTVNTASRMESSSVPGEINITDNTYQYISEYFECEHRGKMPVKYKGEIDMYFVKRIKPEYAENGSAYLPNKLLLQKIRMLKVNDLEKHIEKEIQGLSNKNVLVECYNAFCRGLDKLIIGEKLNIEDSMACKVIGFISFVAIESQHAYKVIVPDLTILLRKMHFPEEQISIINLTISKICQRRHPSSLIEEIVFDAMHEYFGSSNYIDRMKQLYECAIAEGRKVSKSEWMREQKKALSTFSFFTSSAKQQVVRTPQEQIEQIEQIFHTWR